MVIIANRLSMRRAKIISLKLILDKKRIELLASNR